MLIWKPLVAFPLPLAHSYTGPCRRWLLASTTQVCAYVLHHAWKKYKNQKNTIHVLSPTFWSSQGFRWDG